jgi:hypothetical protein
VVRWRGRASLHPDRRRDHKTKPGLSSRRAGASPGSSLRIMVRPPVPGALGRGNDRYFACGIGGAAGAGVSAGGPGSAAGLAFDPVASGARAAAPDARGSGVPAGAAPAEDRVGIGNGGVCAPSSVGDGAAAEAETGGRAASLALVRDCTAPPSAGCRTTLTADDAAGAAPVFAGPTTMTAMLALSVLTTKL